MRAEVELSSTAIAYIQETLGFISSTAKAKQKI